MIKQTNVLHLGFLFIFFFAVTVANSAQDEDWKRQNDRGNRYEGLIGVPTGNPEIEVVSFTGFRESYDSESDMKIRFFLPSTSSPNQSLSIMAREINIIRQYWMEAKPQEWRPQSWNEFSPWPARLLSQEGIPPTNLGVLVSLNNGPNGEKQYLPAFVYHTKSPNPVQQYTLYLRTNKALNRLKYSLYRVSNGGIPNPRIWSTEVEKMAGTPFPVQIDLRGFPEGPMRLVIQRWYAGSIVTPPAYEFNFYYKP
jgi:hypothetical protein